MRFILFVIPLTMFVVGCSSAPQKPENPECVQVAKFARTMATLRDMNVPENEVESFSQVPVALTFPYRKVRSEVYGTKAENPSEVFVKFYNRCDEVGYNSLLQTLKTDERTRIETETLERKKKEAENEKNRVQKIVDDMTKPKSSNAQVQPKVSTRVQPKPNPFLY